VIAGVDLPARRTRVVVARRTDDGRNARRGDAGHHQSEQKPFQDSGPGSHSRASRISQRMSSLQNEKGRPKAAKEEMLAGIRERECQE
jgi:hypothetical protein